MSICNADFCPNRQANGKRYCAEHAHLQPTRTRSAHHGRVGTTARWRRIRARVLRRDRNCCAVTLADGQRCGRPAIEVDHIVPLSLGGADHESNCQAICRDHHRLKSADEQRERIVRRAPTPPGGTEGEHG